MQFTNFLAPIVAILATIIPSADANYSIYTYSCTFGTQADPRSFTAVVPGGGTPCKNYWQISMRYPEGHLEPGDTVNVCRQRATFNGVKNRRLQVSSNISKAYSCFKPTAQPIEQCDLPGLDKGFCFYYRVWGCTTDVCSGDWNP